jgi:flagellar protein FlaF
MYHSSYAEQIEETPRECRDRERRAFDHAIELLENARSGDLGSAKTVQALHFLVRLWRALIEDLMSPDNDLPDILRADLVSIGVWTIKEADSIRVGRSFNFGGLIEVCTIVREGLK